MCHVTIYILIVTHKPSQLGTQLGLRTNVTQFKLTPIPLFMQLEARMVACGSAHSVVLAATGHVFSFGW